MSTSIRVKARHVARFEELVAQLNALREEVKAYAPDATYYLAADVLHLMSGESHEGRDARPRHDRSLASATLHRSGGGDW